MMSFLAVKVAVGNHTPPHSPFSDLPATPFQVIPQQRFSAAQGHDEIPGGFRYGIKGGEEILKRHIGMGSLFRAITPAVQTVEIAPGGALPEEIVQFMEIGFGLFKFPEGKSSNR
jgi:hypothetical protein